MEPSAGGRGSSIGQLPGTPHSWRGPHRGELFTRGLTLYLQEQFVPSSQYPSTHSVIMDDFRRLTIQPMLQATSSMRLTIEQSLETIASTRAALVTVDELARTIDDALMHWRQSSR